jgi:dihydroorotase
MTEQPPYDLAIECNRIVDSSQGIDSPGVILVRDQRIAHVEFSRTPAKKPAVRTVQCSEGILLPGLIDLHAHPAVRNSVFGTAPDNTMLPRGVAAVLSQGDAGADGIDDYVDSTIVPSKTIVRLAINLSRIGESTEGGCLENIRDADIDACVAAIDRHPELVPAIAVNLSHHACGDSDPKEVFRRGLEAARQSDRPILFGLRRPEDWPLAEQLELLRPGDIVTYCFRREPHCIVEKNRVLPCVIDAQLRGVNFDIGHGMASFSFDVAEAAIGDGFLPNTISTDHQSRHVGNDPVHDLPLVMSKLRAAGMDEQDIFAAVTSTPSQLINFGDVPNQIRVGAPARFTLLIEQNDRVLEDCFGVRRNATLWDGTGSTGS